MIDIYFGSVLSGTTIYLVKIQTHTQRDRYSRSHSRRFMHQRLKKSEDSKVALGYVLCASQRDSLEERGKDIQELNIKSVIPRPCYP